MKKILIITTAALMVLAAMALGQGMGQGQGQGQGGGGRFDCDGSMRMQGPGGGRGMGMQGFGCDGMRGMRGKRGFGMRDGDPGLGMMLQFKDELELTDAQISQFKKLMNDFALERIDRKAELEKAELKLRMLMNDDDATETKVNMAIDDVARLKAEMQKMRYAHKKQMQTVLTDAQTEKLDQLRQERRPFFRNQGDSDDDDDSNFQRPRRGRI